MHPDWATSLIDQCSTAGVPVFFKQHGAFTSYVPTVPDSTRPDGRAPDWDRPPACWLERYTGETVEREQDVPPSGDWVAMYRVGKKAAGRLLDGREWSEYPA